MLVGAGTSSKAQNVISWEKFPNTFNTGFGKPINSTFSGSIGTWSAYSNDNKSTIVVNTAYYTSSPSALKLVNFNTSGCGGASTCRATSPTVNLGNLGCVNYVNLSFQLYTYKVVSSNTSLTFYVEVSKDNGTTWNVVYQKTAQQIYAAFGQGTWNALTVAVPSAYHTASFKYRFRGTQNAGCNTDNYLYVDDVKLLSQSCTTASCGPGTLQPTLDAKGFNVFVQQNLLLNNGHVDGAVAAGGNVTLDGAVTIAMNNPGDYPNGSNNVNNYGMVIGGKMVYTSGGQSKVNNGYIRLGDASGSKIWEKDPNNANVNLRITSNAKTGFTGYNSNPALQLQRIQSAASATTASGLNFTNAFNSILQSSATIASFTATSSCAMKMILKSCGSGSNSITLTDNKVNVININGSQFASIGKITFTNKPTAARPVIININQTGNLNWTPFQTAGLDPASGQYILYNFYNATGNIYIDGANPVYGTILAPKASVTWNNSNNLEGQLIARSALLCNGEIHDQPFNACLPDCQSYVPQGWTFSCANGSDDVVDFYAVGTKTAGSNLVTIDIPNPGNVYKVVAFLSGSTAGSTNQTVVLSSRSSTNTVINSATLTAPVKNLNGNMHIWESSFTSTGNVVKVGVQVTNPGAAGYVGNGLTIAVYRSGVPGQFTTGEIPHWGGINNDGSGAGDYNDNFTIPTASSPRTVTVKVVLNEIENDSRYAKITATAGSVTQTLTVNNNGTFGDRVNIVTLTLNNVPGNITSVNVTAAQATSTESYSVDAVSVSVANACANLNLGNLVWNDINANGLKDIDEPGVPGAVVKLYRDDNNDDVPDGAAIATTGTNPQGFYSFSNLGAGNYVVGVIIPTGYTKGPVSSADPDNNIDNDNNGVNLIGVNQAGSEVRTKAISLAAGTEPINDGDDNNGNLTLDIALCGNSQIGDFVWNDVNGNGLQDAGETGLQGVTVTLTFPDGATSTSRTSDANGKYLFTSLAPGEYQIAFATPATFIPSPANTGTDDAKDSDPINGVVTVNLSPATGLLTIDAGFFQPGIHTLGNLVWNDADGDGKKDPNEYTLSGITVSLYTDNNNDDLPDGAAIKTAVTNTNGIYSFTGLVAGRYIISIPILAGFNAGGIASTSNVPDNNVDNDNNGIRKAGGILYSNAITLSAGDEPVADGDGSNSNLTFDIALCGNAAIGDFVWADANCNGIQDAGEEGINGATVMITYPDGTTKTTVSANYLGKNGYYDFINLGPGSFIITFTTPQGYTPSASNIGSNDAVDSDPVNGSVTVNLAANVSSMTTDAGFCLAGGLNLGDNVWNDINDNGIKEANEPGVGGATVYLYRDADGNNLPDGAAIATTLTTIKGLYGFAGLVPGKYIVGVVMPAGYTQGFLSATGNNPDNNINNDNNGVTFIAGEIRTRFITLSTGGEPVDDGDGNNGNLTLDIALKGKGVVGNYVWHDANKDGIQDNNETGISNVTVKLIFPDGTEKTTLTNEDGQYSFVNAGPGNYTVQFSTPLGMTSSPYDEGTDDTKDSDPINGEVTFTLGINEVNNNIDAGFYKSTCIAVLSACGPGYLTVQTSLIKNGDFSIPIASPSANNSFAGNSSTPGLTYNFAGGSFISQAEMKDVNTKPSGERGFSIINTTGAFTAPSVNQLPFPGDAANSVPATNYFMYKNGNDLGGDAVIWEQTTSGLVIGKNYRFRFYVSNMLEPTGDFDNPLVKVAIGGTDGLADGTIVLGPVIIDETSTQNSAPLNGWKRLEYSFTATSVSMTFKIIDAQTEINGADLGLTAISLEVCEKDTDSDCVADVDDIDDDNDGILDVVENGGYDALKDCDNDGIPNYLDATPGCATPAGNDIYGKPFKPLTWSDCNADGINDFFDWDRDGIINELDLDSDNDGILDVQEARDPRAVDNNHDGQVDGIDADGDGLLSTADANDNVYGGPGLTPQDLDKDGTPNYLDLDSDGDGISDIKEALIYGDADGLADGTDGDGDGVRSILYNNNDNTADNFNGFGAKGIRITDTDNDGKGNPYDIDSDDDGITDNVEGQPTCSYIVPKGIDTDGDGLDDAYDFDNNACVRKAAGITPFDKDNDGTPDIYDLDTDNDGAPDVNEGSGFPGNFVTNLADTDGDGLIDQFDIFNINTSVGNYTANVVHSNMGPNGSFDGPLPAGSNAKLPQSGPGNCSTGADRDWRDISILPVTLIEFKGNVNGGTAKLNWTVANEINMHHYIVERSVNGQTFTAVGQLSAKGNTTVTAKYDLTDDVNNLNATTVYYRLNMVENSGNSKYSNTLSFRLSNKASIGLAVHPNPATSYVVLKINAVKDGIAIVRITDMYGKVVSIQNSRVSAGSNAVNFSDLTKMAGGNYNVQVILDGEVMNEKLIIAR